MGIPQFAQVAEKVASGLKPDLDGLAWLRVNGYQTVLHLRRPGEDDTADRRQVEKRGMKFISLEVSPATLSRALLNEFTLAVSNVSSQPVFVYDRDATLAGNLWYLYFRGIELASEEESRRKAGRVGLRPEGTPEQKAMWQAVQQVLAQP